MMPDGDLKRQETPMKSPEKNKDLELLFLINPKKNKKANEAGSRENPSDKAD